MGADELVCQTDLGFGGPGTARLSACGRDLADGPTDLGVCGAAPAQTGWLVVGLDPNLQPFKGGMLVPVPILASVAVPLDAQGEVLVAGITADLVLVPLVVQCVFADPSQPLGFGLTHAVRILPP